MASGEFAVHDDLWKAMVFYSGNVTSPSELAFQDHGFDAGDLGLLDVGDEAAPVVAGVGPQAALVETSEGRMWLR